MQPAAETMLGDSMVYQEFQTVERMAKGWHDDHCIEPIARTAANTPLLLVGIMHSDEITSLMFSWPDC